MIFAARPIEAVRAEASEGISSSAAGAAILTRAGVTDARQLEVRILALVAIVTRLAAADVLVETVDASGSVLTRIAGALVWVEPTVRAEGSQRTVAHETLDGIRAPDPVLTGVAIAIVVINLADLSGRSRHAIADVA